VRLIRVRLVLVNLNPINDTYIPPFGTAFEAKEQKINLFFESCCVGGGEYFPWDDPGTQGRKKERKNEKKIKQKKMYTLPSCSDIGHSPLNVSQSELFSFFTKFVLSRLNPMFLFNQICAERIQSQNCWAKSG